ncbi:MAG: copper-binding protein [Burkholderiaceae bacterium]|nr:copper-binding protein [Burkholderiaceae bacterium]
MKTLNKLAAAALLAIATPFAATAYTQAPEPAHPTSMIAETMASADMTDGEVRKIDKDNQKITLKHGEIKNLDMPPMTMVFQGKAAAMLDKVETGDKIRFVVQKSESGFVVTDLESAR